MKKLFFAGIALAMLVACNNQSQNTGDAQDSQVESTENINQNGNGEIVFESTEFDFGTIKDGEVIDHTFTFTNQGTEPVIIAQVSASCGCTTPSYTKEPILPGKQGHIDVNFNSAGQLGVQQKIITVSSNAKNSVLTVQLKGTVEK